MNQKKLSNKELFRNNKKFRQGALAFAGGMLLTGASMFYGVKTNEQAPYMNQEPEKKEIVIQAENLDQKLSSKPDVQRKDITIDYALHIQQEVKKYNKIITSEEYKQSAKEFYTWQEQTTTNNKKSLCIGIALFYGLMSSFMGLYTVGKEKRNALLEHK